jgi:hypothetical protein
VGLINVYFKMIYIYTYDMCVCCSFPISFVPQMVDRSNNLFVIEIN